MSKPKTGLIVSALLIALAWPAHAATDELTTKQDELAKLEQKIAQLKAKHATASSQSDQAAIQVERLGQELKAAELQLEQTLLTISSLKLDIQGIEDSIEHTAIAQTKVRGHLGDVIIALYHREQTSIIDIILSSSLSLSTVFADQRAFHQLQKNAQNLILELRQQQNSLITQREQLANREREFNNLRLAQAYQQNAIADQKVEQQQVLTLKQSEQANYKNKIAEATDARQEIEQAIFTLKGSGLEVELTDAFSAARYASSITGVRPSLLLAVLKVETNVGATLGTGTFPDDMHPTSREPFLRLMKKLDRDPNTTPISRRPRSYAGWGGAIGPGQIMPQTWEGIESRVAGLMSKPIPDPFELADALVAVGVMLADRGATESVKEIEALGRYIAGPNWQYHTWYSIRVLAVAAEYAKEDLD